MEYTLNSLKMMGECEGVETALFGCYDGGVDGLLARILTFLTYGVAAAGVLGLVIAGIQYMTASGDPATMVKAKNRIVQVVIGLVAYGVLWLFLEWLIPGGVL